MTKLMLCLMIILFNVSCNGYDDPEMMPSDRIKIDGQYYYSHVDGLECKYIPIEVTK